MYKDILFAVDLEHPETQEKAVATVLKLVRTFGAGLHAIHVVPDFGMALVGGFFPEDFEQKAMERGRNELHAFTKEKIPEDIAVQHIIGHGSIYGEILRVAEEIDIDLIVMASHRPELQDFILGPNAAHVVRFAKCSVLVVR
jgi:nucleotide-binding universal stress UspA family protein